jgi:hypothetical protein|uniref:Uncharacterized protein n=1 Tax=Picea glauca TaxID=3330 RepID=A0A101M1L4_PICGL|nr:hypothetical protein ABT39_MTgene3879 [Picea glauca]
MKERTNGEIPVSVGCVRADPSLLTLPTYLFPPKPKEISEMNYRYTGNALNKANSGYCDVPPSPKVTQFGARFNGWISII